MITPIDARRVLSLHVDHMRDRAVNVQTTVLLTVYIRQHDPARRQAVIDALLREAVERMRERREQ